MIRIQPLGIALIGAGLLTGLLVAIGLLFWEQGARGASPLATPETPPPFTATALPSPQPTLTPQAGETPTPTTPGTTPPPATATPLPPTSTPASKASFSNDIMPIFKKSCIPCHGTLGGLSLESYQALMTTGKHKPQVVPGDPTGSYLMKTLRGEGSPPMPPGKPLTEEQIRLIAQWVSQGAENN